MASRRKPSFQLNVDQLEDRLVMSVFKLIPIGFGGGSNGKGSGGSGGGGGGGGGSGGGGGGSGGTSAGAVTVKFLDLDNNNTPDLQITGNTGNQIVKIVDDPDANRTTLSIDLNGDGDFSDKNEIKDLLLATGFEIISVSLGDGNDQFIYETANPGDLDAPAGSPRRVQVNMGAGNDVVTANLHNNVSDLSILDFTSALGKGNDTFTANLDLSNFTHIDGPGTDEQAVMRFNVDAGQGDDTMLVTRNETRNPLAIKGTLDINLLGNSGRDNMTVDIGGTPNGTIGDVGMLNIQGTVRVRMDGGGDSDLMFLNLRNTDDSVGTYDVQVAGGAGNDQMFFSIFDDSKGGVTFIDPVLFDGGDGNADQGFVMAGQNAPVTRVDFEP